MSLARLQNAIRKQIQADREFDDAFDAWLLRTPSVDDQTGWDILDWLGGLVSARANHDHAGRKACRDMFNGLLGGGSIFPEAQIIGFLRWYGDKVMRAQGTWQAAILNADRDTSDRCDSLPLAGREIYERALNGEFKSATALKQEIRQYATDTYASLVAYGFGDMRASLLAACKQYLRTRMEQQLEQETQDFQDVMDGNA